VSAALQLWVVLSAWVVEMRYYRIGKILVDKLLFSDSFV